MGGGRTTGVSETPLRSGQRGKTITKPDLVPSLPSSSPHTRHPCKHVGYSEVPDPEADSFIWCSTCRKEEYNSCEKNITYFGDNKEFKLEVGKSSVGGRVMGVGVVNRGEMLPEGVLFGPYTDKFITAAKYKEMKKAKNEARNSWEIRDTFINKTVPYTDPVTKEQNLAGFQLAGQNYYRVRVIMNIPFGKELLVWYGETYAEEIGIEVGTVGKNTGEEDLTKEAVKCEYCGTEIAGEEKLEEHMGKGVNGKYRCGVKQAKEMVRITEGGERRFVCKVCVKGFKTKQNLSNHSSTHTSTHTKDKAFKCVVEGCTKRYASVGGLLQHKKAVHEGVYYE
jgi:hypothetical protein